MLAKALPGTRIRIEAVKSAGHCRFRASLRVHRKSTRGDAGRGGGNACSRVEAIDQAKLGDQENQCCYR